MHQGKITTNGQRGGSVRPGWPLVRQQALFYGAELLHLLYRLVQLGLLVVAVSAVATWFGLCFALGERLGS